MGGGLDGWRLLYSPQEKNCWRTGWVLSPTCSAQVRGTAENPFKYFDRKNGTFLLNIFGNTIASPCISQIGDAEKLFLPFPELL